MRRRNISSQHDNTGLQLHDSPVCCGVNTPPCLKPTGPPYVHARQIVLVRRRVDQFVHLRGHVEGDAPILARCASLSAARALRKDSLSHIKHQVLVIIAPVRRISISSVSTCSCYRRTVVVRIVLASLGVGGTELHFLFPFLIFRSVGVVLCVRAAVGHTAPCLAE